MDHPNFFGDYDTLLELVRNRISVRKLKPDPIPDEYVDKILEIGRWAMSGANGQPWEFVVVKDPKIKAGLFAGAGADRDPRRWAAPVGNGARCPHLWARPVASHRRPRQHRHDDASR